MQIIAQYRYRFIAAVMSLFVIGVVAAQPESVTIAGTIQSVLGCPDNWLPECDITDMTYNADSDSWFASFDLPAGDYEVKVAYNGTWEENYGLNGVAGGPNIPFTLEAEATVDFSYSERDNILNIGVDGESLVGEAAPAPQPQTNDITQPELVNVPGTFQPLLGCPGEWAPDCLDSALEYDEVGDVWLRTHEIPAGEYEYKVAINGTWDENYGGMADPGGPNIVLNVPEDQEVTFIYDHKTNWISDNVRQVIATVPGNFNSELGCTDDWLPDCMRTWLQDVDGDGLYTFTTSDIPAGDYEAKVAINRTWDENYGVDGVADGANIPFTVAEDGDAVTFAYDPEQTTLVIVTGGTAISASDLSAQRGYWLARDTLAWNIESDGDYALLYSADASISVDLTGLAGDFETVALSVDDAGLGEDILAKFPHLEGYTALKLDESMLEDVPTMLRGQFFLATLDGDNVTNITGVQIPGVLDDVYADAAMSAPLGVTLNDGVPTLSVWAPTAQNVRLMLFADNNARTDAEYVEMTRNDATGIWSVEGDADWMNLYYLYEVTVYAPSTRTLEVNEVTDPYSISLSMNSQRSQIVDLNDPALMPEGWTDLEKPALDAPEDIVLYELHIRDFSIFDESVPEDFRGTYMAFTVEDSNGMQHLSGLSDAGLTHVHLLPTFDIATIIENRERQFEPDYEALAALPPNSEEQQAIINEIRDLDGFNWGYDPYHFNVPEGSYSTDPNSPQRLLEFREMVQALNEAGLRVVMDVVYNHTNASGQNPRSVLDRVVPGYYHRLSANGTVERSTCCENTATEHDMMRRFMVDSVVLYSTAYKIDGYRFDLMGHHMLEDMLAVREALDALTLEDDGIDGSSVYVYGEGWNFGEVADNARGVNATQLNIGGTGIGVFNDRLRDAVRGGNPFGGWQDQGFINGLATDPNGVTAGTEEEQLERLLLFSDQIRVGLAGNLADFTFTNRMGDEVRGDEVDYNGSPAGYTQDPQENILYASAHDNETLWDAITYKAPESATVADRVRMQNLGVSIVGFSQGIPFYHAGGEMLRSKSMDRNSYNSGDWFNRLDFTYQTNNFGVGLPPAADNQQTWDIQRPLLANPDIIPTTEDILNNVMHTQEVLQIRMSTPLFRLQTGEAVQERVAFHNTGPDQLPGVIVMSISDTVGDDLDSAHDLVVVVFNGRNEQIDLTVEAVMGAALELHPIQVNSNDPIVQGSTFDSETGTFSVPARTTAVFVLPQG